MCGEQKMPYHVVNQTLGSPPRVRGTDNFPGAGSVHGGITPACAGNSDAGYGGMGLYGDHPRVCGEQVWKSSTAWP